MKLTIKNLNKRYGLDIKSVYSPEHNKMVWSFTYEGKEYKFETKAKIAEFMKSIC